jgi:hypothetical protein
MHAFAFYSTCYLLKYSQKDIYALKFKRSSRLHGNFCLKLTHTEELDFKIKGKCFGN